jgi:hypothetical protein
MIAWLIGITLFLVIWTSISLYAFTVSLPNMFSLTWNSRLLYIPVLVIVTVLAWGDELKYKWDLKRGKVDQSWKHT